MSGLLSRRSVQGGHTADQQQEASYFLTLRDEGATFQSMVRKHLAARGTGAD